MLHFRGCYVTRNCGFNTGQSIKQPLSFDARQFSRSTPQPTHPPHWLCLLVSPSWVSRWWLGAARSPSVVTGPGSGVSCRVSPVTSHQQQRMLNPSVGNTNLASNILLSIYTIHYTSIYTLHNTEYRAQCGSVPISLPRRCSWAVRAGAGR